ncbi:MAG TPA: HD domain-containing protein [Ktedonobacterales bacterium]|nr:HD domain-containing protein [Ktedonobacterales bacterium]
MNRDAILAEAEAFAREVLTGESSGHDWWHIARVRALARTIAGAEHADAFVCELAALLHDIADPKIAGDWDTGLARVRGWLAARDISAAEREHVLEIIASISFAGGNKPQPQTLEGCVVQDADRLDAIGAMGIARAFAYGGAHGRILYDPAIAPRAVMTADEYRSRAAPTINHFYEKLLLLKERMNTDYARRLAERRHRVMEEFLDEFYAEWDGNR